MTIFKIQQHGMPKDALTEDKTRTAVTIPAEEGKEPQAALAQSASTVTPETTTSVAASSESNTDEIHEQPAVMIRVDGPVGRIYTDALNKLLATESYLTMVPTEDIAPPPTSEPDDAKTIALYAMDPDKMEVSDVVEILNDASTHQGTHYVVAAECIGRVPKHVAVLEHLATLPNVQVKYTRQGALQAVKDLLS